MVKQGWNVYIYRRALSDGGLGFDRFHMLNIAYERRVCK